MRFFSNEAKETDDDPEAGENNRAQAEGAPVPQQRSGSPWSDTPGTASDTTDVNGTDPLANESLKTDDSEVRHDGDDLVRDDDAPRSDEHDDLDLPLDGRTTETDEYQAGSHRADSDADTTDAPADATDAPEAGQLNGTTTTYGPDGSVTTAEEPADTTTDTDPDADVDTAVDTDAEKDAEPVATDTVDRTDEDRDLDEAAPAVGTAPVETTTADDSAVDDSTVAATTPADTTVDSATDDSAPVEDTATDADAAPAVAAVPVGAADAATTTEAAKPDPTANPVGDKLFTDGDSFNDRLRDITFNFVDDPQEATQQAAGLVDEAIDKVTSALKAQKDALASEGNDTEKLRVELRGYRDILQRLTAL